MINLKYEKKLNQFNLDINFKMPETGVTVLFGPSGAGKSSVLNLIAGLDDEYEVTEAYFKFNDCIFDDFKQAIKMPPWLRNIAYVFQEHRLFPHLSVNENILFGYTRNNSSLDIKQIIEKFKITNLLMHYPAQLSGGQKQRVSLVRALLSDPKLLILDEPLAALDYQSKQELLPYIECIHKELNIPMIYVSHDIKEVLRMANYIVIIDKGKVTDQGDIAKLCISQPLLTQAEGASFILQGKVINKISDEKLVEIECENQSLLIVDQMLELNQLVRILIHAKDVSLCLQPPVDSSILNCLPVIVEELFEIETSKYRVILKMGQQTLVSIISFRSAKQLNVMKGQTMFAQFKATAMIK